MPGCLGLIMWAIISVYLVGALGGNEAQGEVYSHLPLARHTEVAVKVFAVWFLVWASGVVVWMLGTRIWRRVKS